MLCIFHKLRVTAKLTATVHVKRVAQIVIRFARISAVQRSDRVDKLVVFLDSSEYKRCGHNFDCRQMRKLKDLVDKNIIRLVSNTVVNGEVSEHIDKDVKDFLEAQKKLVQKAGGLRNIPEYSDIMREINSEDLKQKAQQAFLSFIASTQCEILSCNGIDNDALLGDYFAKRHPFEKRADKAAEFKDAFTSYTLKHYAEENAIDIQVVSSDKGLCASFSGNNRFQVFEKTEDLFSYITAQNRGVPLQNAKTIESFACRDDIRTMLTSKIENTIMNAGVWVDGAEEDCELLNVEVKNFSLSYIDDIKEHLISTHFDVVVVLTIAYTYINKDMSYRDKEENAYLFLEMTKLRIIKELHLDFRITFSVNADDEGQISCVNDIEELDIEEDTRYGIRIEPEDDNDEIIDFSSSLDEIENEDNFPYCPICGQEINFENDAGNGLCIHCAQNQ